MPTHKMSQSEIRKDICDKLHEASSLVARVSNDLTLLHEANPDFVSLAKVMADNFATLLSNLESRVKYPHSES